MPGTPRFAPAGPVVRCRERGRRSRFGAVDGDAESMVGNAGNADDFGTGCEVHRPAAHRQRDRAVSRPEIVGNPLDHVAVNPFELARHRRRRFDVNGALSSKPVGDRRTERHDYGMCDSDNRARLRQYRRDGVLKRTDRLVRLRLTDCGRPRKCAGSDHTHR